MSNNTRLYKLKSRSRALLCTIALLFVVFFAGIGGLVMHFIKSGAASYECYIEDNLGAKTYYDTLEAAVASADALSDASTIYITSDYPSIDSELDITNDITIASDLADGTNASISKAGDFNMFYIPTGGTLTLRNVTLNGNGKKFSTLMVSGGRVNINSGVKINNCSNTLAGVGENKDKEIVSGPGTICIASNGSVVMYDGMISGNHPSYGGGVYLYSGVFDMRGGSITGNVLTSGGAGAGIYVCSSQYVYLSGDVKISGNQTSSLVEQNVYYTTLRPASSGQNVGGIQLKSALAATAEIGVTPTYTPTGVTSATMIDVTDSTSAEVVAADADIANKIVPDLSGYENFVDTSDSRNIKIRMRYGHTITFNANGGVISGNYTGIDEDGNAYTNVVDKSAISILPTASIDKYLFDGWFFSDGTQLTNTSQITSSATVTAHYTNGRCSTPEVTFDPEVVSKSTDGKGVVTYNIALSGDSTDSAKIYLKSSVGVKDASGNPVNTQDIYTIKYTTNGDDPKTSATLNYSQSNGILLQEDATINAYAYSDGYTDSDTLTFKVHVINVNKVTMDSWPETLYRRYSDTFEATVVPTNTSTKTGITWSIQSVTTSSATAISEKGVLTVGAGETATSITVRAASTEDPTKYVEKTVPVTDQYKVTYYPNKPADYSVTGSVGDSNSPYLVGSSVTILSSAYKCSGKSYSFTFVEWNTSADGSGTSYQPGDVIESINQDLNLYAIWKSNVVINKVTVSPTGTSIKPKKIDQGASYQFKANVDGTGDVKGTVTWTIAPSKDTQVLATGTYVSGDGTVYIDENEETTYITLTATSTEDTTKIGTSVIEVTPLTRYTVTYDARGGAGDMSSENKSYVVNTKVTVAANQYTKTNYAFTGWNTLSTGRGISYAVGDKFTITEDVTLFAQWKRVVDDVASSDAEEEASSEASAEAKVMTDQDYVNEVKELIEKIVEESGGNVEDAKVTEDMLPDIKAARAAYNALTSDQKELFKTNNLSEYNKLVKIEQIYQATFVDKTISKASVGAETKEEEKSPYTVYNPISPLKKGSVFIMGSYKYKVIDSSQDSPKVTMLGFASTAIAKEATKVNVPYSTRYLGVTYKITKIAPKAFANKNKLKEVWIEANVTDIGTKAFYNCDLLLTVTAKGKVKNIWKQAFAECDNLEKVILGKNVKKIAAKAFYNDKDLRYVKVNTRKLASIGTKAFNGSNHIVYFRIKDFKYRAYHDMLVGSGMSDRFRFRTF